MSFGKGLKDNKNASCGCQRWAVGCLIEDKKSNSKKGHNFELYPLMAWTALWIVNTFSEFQVIIFGNNRYITKCQIFRTTTTPRL